MSTYRAAIIGCGGRARWHAQAYQWVPQAEVVACCDLDPQRAERFGREFGLAPYTEAREMIVRESPDLVHLVTLPTARVELMELINGLGVPGCLVEKPIAYQVRDWRALVDLAARAETRFGVGAQFRYHPALAHCREAVRSGRLGRLLFLEGSAGSTVCDQGVHNLDWAMSLNGDQPPVRIYGLASGNRELSGRQPSPEMATAQILFANGVSCAWSLGGVAPRVGDAPQVWKHGRIAAYCERGRVLYEEFRHWEIASSAGVERGGVADMDAWTQGNHRAQANLTCAMYAWLADEAQPVSTNLSRALQQWNAILGLYASTVYRKPIDLPFDPPDDLWERLAETLE